MSFTFRPLLAVAAIALAMPAFAQVGTTSPSTDKMVSAPAPTVSAPAQTGTTPVTGSVKSDSMAKASPTSTPAASASTSTDTKSSAKPAEKPAKVSSVKHHKAKTVKTAAVKSDSKSETTTK